MIHELKIDHEWGQRLRAGEKRCEVRLNDRDYQVGDTLEFRCTRFTGGQDCPCMSGHLYVVTHVLTAFKGLEASYCVLSVRSRT